MARSSPALPAFPSRNPRMQACWEAVAQGVVNWPSLMQSVMARATWIFSVPIGNASAPARSRTLPRQPYYFVAYHCVKSTAPRHLAKLLVYTLRTPPDALASAEPGALSSLRALEQLAALLEHWFHPSNRGSWSDALGAFLDALASHLSRRLDAECQPAWSGSAAVRLATEPTAIAPVVEAVLRLAEPAVFHKSSSMRVAALECLPVAAYLLPQRVLPGVVNRLFLALDASDSVHQLATSIRALSCAPPAGR